MRGLVMTVLTLVLAVPVKAQLSPGKLAKPHQSLEGTTQCLKCHQVSRREAMDRTCLACHREIGRLLQEKRGLHSREGSTRCSSCHPDHAGEDFALIPWTRDSIERFQHRRAGWILDGAHERTKCADCHAEKYLQPSSTALAPGARTEPWTGLDRACATCHDDVHRGRVSRACTDCHTTAKWDPAPRFNHDSTKYPLTGRHDSVACTGCHPVARSPDQGIDPAFPALKFGQCSACHSDPHQGRLGAQCADCHVTTGFGDRGPKGFNHARTRYPLEGRHAGVECEQCHGRRTERPRPVYASCAACHADPHAGAATVAGKPVDCAVCHDERGFDRSNWTAARHRTTRYPLEGRHQTVACGQCHRRERAPQNGPAAVVMRPPFRRCADCHADAHTGETRKVASGECSACHTTGGWEHSRLQPAEHERLGMALTERHAAAACRDCHTPQNGKVVFPLGGRDCASCHADPHEPRYPACADCHVARGFVPSTVDSVAHSAWRLPLTGAHLAVPCAGCHGGFDRPRSGSALAAKTKPAPLKLSLPDPSCEACHQDPHAGQFVAAARQVCGSCHGTQGFRPADRFDHNRDAGFRLDRGHTAVPCGSCHPRGRYRGTPTRCEECHR
jgi:hypothetical protein